MMAKEKTIGIWSGVIAFFLVLSFASASFAAPKIIAVIKSRDLAPYDLALAGFNQVLQQEGIKAWLVQYDIEGSKEIGDKIAKEIIAKKPDLVLTLGSIATDVACKKIKHLPVVFSVVLNPVASGFVTSMETPSGNMTGSSLDIPVKTQFEALTSLVPKLKKVGVIYNPQENRLIINETRAVCKEVGLDLVTQAISSKKEVPEAMEYLSGKIDALWMAADSTTFSPKSREFILLYTLRQGIPFMGISPHFVKAGALLSLSCDYHDIGRQAGESACRILAGAQPANLPVTIPRRVNLSINLKTAGRIGIEVPPKIIKEAKEVFE